MRWLRDRCSRLDDRKGTNMEVLRALSCGPSRHVCSFRSMISYGSHYRVEDEGGGAAHVTYDCGIAELGAREAVNGGMHQSYCVEIVRVGTLKDILVLNYTNTSFVLMLVSWLTKDTEQQPRLRRDAHGLWLANMHVMPHCSQNPYILPSLASQVTNFSFEVMLRQFAWRCASESCGALIRERVHVHVFFMPDKANPGWSVVLQKETQGRRINHMDEDLCIGQEESVVD